MTVRAGTIVIEFSTAGNEEIVDLTQKVAAAISDFGLKEGVATVFAVGSTGSVTTIEYEPGLKEDIKKFLRDVAPAGDWRHNETWGDGNGHSHIRASLLGPSLAVPVANGEMTLGTWQQIVFIDSDIRSRNRRVVVQMTGEAST